MNKPTPTRLALALAFVASGAVTAAVWGAQRDTGPDPALLIGVGGPVCLPTTPAGRQGKAFFKLAAATTELGPYGRRPAPQAGPAAQREPPLWTNLGTLSYPVSTRNGAAQRYFDQGLRLAYAFNHSEARRAFRQAQKLDPQCAMCWWGEALVLGPNINAPMDPAANAPALAALERARELAEGAGAAEQALIEALAARYSKVPDAPRAQLDAAYADAMGRVAARFPHDRNIAVLHAEAMMDVSPWDYWEAGGAQPKGRTAQIIAVLEGVLKDDPRHPGAVHYYIHMVEASADPARALPYARHLATAMPGAGHLVHMPFHIYFRVGQYQEALAANKAAVAADERYIAEEAPQGIYPLAYYPHNVHSLMTSAQMAGDGRSVIAAADKLARVVSTDAARNIPWVQPIMAAPYFAHAQLSDTPTVLALPDPGDDFPYVRAMWHYARGVALAAAGNGAAAQREADAIAGLARSADFSDLAGGGVPVTDVLGIAGHVVRARIAQAQGDAARAVTEFEQAVALEDRLPYMEPPFWYYPLRQSLGAALLQASRADEAEFAFRTSLARAPNNGWALYGLSEVYRRQGDGESAAAAERLLAKAWAGERRHLDLGRL
jgi:tetratricopeptide (TPR) repeat protein